MWTLTVQLLCVFAASITVLVTADHTGDTKYTNSASTGNVVDTISTGNILSGQFASSDGSTNTGGIGRGSLPSPRPISSTDNQLHVDSTGGRFASSSGAGANVAGSADRFRPAGATNFGTATGGTRFGQAGVGASGFNIGGRGAGAAGVGAAFGTAQGAAFGSGQGAAFGSGQGAAFGSGQGAAFASGQGATRVVEAPVTPTVTKTITIDHFVTATDLAFHSVPVTLTDLVVRTTTLTTARVIRTPVDDRVALQTTVVIRPTSLTVTCSKYYYNVVTEVSVDHVIITHTSYIIDQVTYTTTATQASTYASTMVRTIVHTQRTTVTDYHTITNTVHGQAGAYYY
ncbi:uncharacterized protein [Panulirus ornatus]|uniref:uncharacterized protein n=1 Tax=Panulirus ornatus TaxID=150431 RepID=UPI003A8B6CCC